MIRAQAILHCHPFRFDYSYVAVWLIKAVSQAADCKDLCLLPHSCPPWALRSNPPFTPPPSSQPSCLAFTLCLLEPSHGIPNSQSSPFLAGLPLFKQAAGSCPSTAGLCPRDSRCLFGFRLGPPLRASVSPLPMPLTLPTLLPHPTAQPLGSLRLSASRPPQTTNPTLHPGNSSPLS